MTKTALFPVLYLATGFFNSVSAQKERPNIIIILTDDMGYSDIGCYGGEIPTPNIDRLAKNGIRFNSFYNAARSCPTRASLLTGLYQHQTGIGMMTSEGNNNFDFQVEGYRGFLNKNCVTIAEVLKQADYNTYMTGKWHLGSDTFDKRPLQRGFDKFYGSYQGAFSYFNPNGDRCLIDGADTIKAPENFYSTDAFTDKAIEYIETNNKEKPFFLYLAYNAPHWPLHAKPEDIELFKGKYMSGWDELRQKRLEKQVKLGLFDSKLTLSPRDTRVRQWTDVSEKQKELSDYRMAVYAAQVYAIDYNIGKLIDYLESKGEIHNTLIMFLSDNGACAEPYNEFGGSKQSDINNPEKWGSVSYGLGWANLSNTPFKLYKNSAYEGGIVTPFIAHWPAKIRKTQSEITKADGHIIQIMPTILEVSGAKYPQTYNGNAIQKPEGRSLLSTFITGKQSKNGYMFFEHSYNRAVINGKWKAVSRIGSDNWLLFNLENDKTELNDLSSQYPKVVVKMAKKWDEWAIRTKVLPKGIRTKNSYD